MSRTRFYKIWKGMFTRCYNQRHESYANYGKRGIVVCDRWKAFENFKEDMFDEYEKHIALFGEKDTSLDRRDFKGNYTSENCQWATKKEQCWNKKMFKLDNEKIKEIRSLYQWGNGRNLAKQFGVNASTISAVVNRRENYAFH